MSIDQIQIEMLALSIPRAKKVETAGRELIRTQY